MRVASALRGVARRGEAWRGAAGLRSVALIPLVSAAESDRHVQHCVWLLDKLLKNVIASIVWGKHAGQPRMSYGNVMYWQFRPSGLTRQMLDAFGTLVGCGVRSRERQLSSTMALCKHKHC